MGPISTLPSTFYRTMSYKEARRDATTTPPRKAHVPRNYPLTPVADVRAWQAHTATFLEANNPLVEHVVDPSSPTDGGLQRPVSALLVDAEASVDAAGASMATDERTSSPAETGPLSRSMVIDTDAVPLSGCLQYSPTSAHAAAPSGEIGTMESSPPMRDAGIATPEETSHNSSLSAEFRQEFSW
ncbi:hypothetical protein S40288_11466 [Stachybotrys chartarum IBT 40288]|nr:hypothetical protein S40288_11466 [Stachybotrys chartarum IBT 40288]